MAERLSAASQRDLDLLAAVRDRPKARALLLTGGVVLSMDPELGDLAPGDVLILDDRIVAFGADLSERPDARDAVVVNCAGMILAPGFQDTHRHAWQGQLRRYLPDADLNGYILNMHAKMAHHYRPEDIYAGNVVAAVGAIDAGITTVLDFSHNSRSAAHTDSAIQAWVDTGIRAVHASCAPLDGAWDEQWPADLRRLRGELPGSSRVTLRMGLVGKVVPEFPDLVALNADNLLFARDLGLEISVDGIFTDYVAAQVVDLGKAGLLGPDITYIHCTDISNDAWRVIADTGGQVSLAPTSDAQVGMVSGVPPVQKAIDFGTAPSIGVDVECCLSSDMFSNMRALLTVQRMNVYTRRHAGEQNVPALLTDREVLTFATVNGARANGFAGQIGTLAPGMKADLIAVNANDVNLFPLNNAVGSVVQGADPRNIEFVLIDGKPVKWQGKVLSFDVDNARELAERSRDYVFAAGGVPVDPLQ